MYVHAYIRNQSYTPFPHSIPAHSHHFIYVYKTRVCELHMHTMHVHVCEHVQIYTWPILYSNSEYLQPFVYVYYTHVYVFITHVCDYKWTHVCEDMCVTTYVYMCVNIYKYIHTLSYTPSPNIPNPSYTYIIHMYMYILHMCLTTYVHNARICMSTYTKPIS